MAASNPYYRNLGSAYLFSEIAKRTKAFAEKNSGVKIMKLGIGNTTEPLPPSVISGLINGVKKLASAETYTGYGEEQGNAELRKRIIEVKYKDKIKNKIDIDEVFVSDGAKPDSANIQELFSKDCVVAIQDPAYPVYVDSNVLAGRTGKAKENGQYPGIVYMPCVEENDFFPDLPEKADLIYLCSPNNPTGAVATKEQLKKFVDYAIAKKAIIIFDSAYARFISDESLPKSIYEIDGAEKCAIEIGSFSKEAGFAGVRLSWTIVPKTLETEDNANLNKMWNQRQCIKFNEASNIVQEGGLAVLSEEGQKETQEIINLYMNNAKIIRNGLESIGIKTFGGINAPYIWMKCPNGMDSWDFFNKLLEEAHVVGTPGIGFGPAGAGYFRLSAFGHTEDVKKAVESIRKNLRV